MNKDTHNIANNYFTLLTEAKKKVKPPVRPPTENEKTDPWDAAMYAVDVVKERVPELEPLILTDTPSVIEYVFNVVKKRWPEGEKVLAKWPDPGPLVGYAARILKDRWVNIPDIPKDLAKMAEQSIIHDRSMILDYVKDVVKGRWFEAEPTILRNKKHTRDYAKLLKRIGYPEDEDNEEQDEDVINDPVYYDATTDSFDEIDAYLGYAFKEKKRWPELEKVLLDNYLFEQAIAYTMEILKKRWPELEEILYDPNNNNPNFPYLRKEYEDSLNHINYEDED